MGTSQRGRGAAFRTLTLPLLAVCVAVAPAQNAPAPKYPLPKRPNLRLVDYGSDMGYGAYQGHMSVLLSGPGGLQVDVDGDGEASDDSVSGWPFSLTQPLNPMSEYYNTQAPNWRFYGGVLGFHANNPRARLTEGMLNENHELRDDCNMMSNQGAAARRKGNTVQAYGVWVCQKEDFLNGADEHRVTFDDESLLAVHISRYWDDVDGGRWLVRDGERLFLSERQFGTPEEIAKRGRKTRLSWVLPPTTTRWAQYQPKAPHLIAFDETQARFEAHTFADVTAVGFYIE